MPSTGAMRLSGVIHRCGRGRHGWVPRTQTPSMDRRTPSDPTIVVTTADPDLLDHALSVVAAAGLEAQVTSDLGSLRSLWPAASMLLIGVDQAPGVANLNLGRHAEVYLLAEAG